MLSDMVHTLLIIPFSEIFLQTFRNKACKKTLLVILPFVKKMDLFKGQLVLYCKIMWQTFILW